MKVSQYVRQDRAISAADSGGIRERWLYGLRLLRDPDAMSTGGGGLKHGVTAQLVAAAQKAGLKLSDREIQRRIQCAKAYETEDQIRRAVADFGTWRDLSEARFPALAPTAGEPLADHRTEAEIRHDRAQQLADLADRQGTLFPLSRFEPAEVTLKVLVDYAEQQSEITARFAAHDAKRAAYLADLIEAADGDLDMTWQAAHDLMPGDEQVSA